MQKKQVSSKKKNRWPWEQRRAFHVQYAPCASHAPHHGVPIYSAEPVRPTEPTHPRKHFPGLVGPFVIRSPPAPRAGRRWKRRRGTAKNAISLSRQASLVPSDPGPGVLPAPRVPPVGDGIAGPCPSVPPLAAASNQAGLRSKAIYQEEIAMNTPDCLLRPEGVGSLQDIHPARIKACACTLDPVSTSSQIGTLREEHIVAPIIISSPQSLVTASDYIVGDLHRHPDDNMALKFTC
jgi:hypothetical protein